MLDMRYHIASLVAVFFALAIGILLGTVIVEKGVPVNQQQQLVKRIESNFTELRTENRMLQEEVNEQRDFAHQIIPLAEKDRLAGKNVAVIATTKVPDEVTSGLLDNVKKAGATAFSIEVVDGFHATDKIVQQMQPYFSTPLTAENARELLLKRMVDELTVNNTTASTATNPAIKDPYLLQLKYIGLIKTDLALNAPVNAITSAVIIGGSDTEQDPRQTDLHLISQLIADSIRVAGVETTDCKKSYMKTYQGAGIPTVDDINQPMGIISTVFVLAGSDGNFGVKKSASRLMPAL